MKPEGGAAAATVAGPATYVGLFLVTLATLMYEILLTRIFSVTMWYHFAFVAISVAMFGMTVGAIVVYSVPASFASRTSRHLTLSALLFALSIVFAHVTHLRGGVVPEASLAGMAALALTYTAASVPFFFSGVCVCLALTTYRAQVGGLYAADLGGAALGCVLVIYTLDLTDGPTAVLVVAALAGLGGLAFATRDADSRRLRRIAVLSVFVMGALAAAQGYAAAHQVPLLGLLRVKGRFEAPPLYEKWNSFSRVHVQTWDARPFGWGISAAYPPGRRVEQLWLQIDGDAGTPLTRFDGDLAQLDYLKYDVVNLVHHLKRDASVLVLGAGGGRDILSALVFGQRSAVGVELNENVLDAVNGKFGDFTGHLDRHPKVTLVNDEARSYLTRQRERFDIIQASLIDTWAATAAGAYVLSENGLYTVEAWTVFLSRLARDGVLTFSRWYFGDTPYEAYRLTSLARAALVASGVGDPRRHIVLVRYMSARFSLGDGVGTILVKREPFSEGELDTVDAVSRTMGFEVMLSPRVAAEPVLAAIVAGEPALPTRVPLDLAAPTDDRPFFFHVVRLRDLLRHAVWVGGAVRHSVEPVFVLAGLLGFVLALTLVCVIVPLLARTDRAALAGAAPSSLFFAAIGFGFMFVEISQMQRLIIFLGHPTYGLSVVLFGLLVSSGAGSYATRRIGEGGFGRSATTRLALLASALVLFGVLTPPAIAAFRGSATPVRILVAAAMLVPAGFLMGMAFPLGMRVASRRSPALTPWLWGLNGATSVCASVLAIVLALGAGISAVFWSGVGCYFVAMLAIRRASRQEAA